MQVCAIAGDESCCVIPVTTQRSARCIGWRRYEACVLMHSSAVLNDEKVVRRRESSAEMRCCVHDGYGRIPQRRSSASWAAAS